MASSFLLNYTFGSPQLRKKTLGRRELELVTVAEHGSHHEGILPNSSISKSHHLHAGGAFDGHDRRGALLPNVGID